MQPDLATLAVAVPAAPVSRTCTVCGVDDDRPAHIDFQVTASGPVQHAHHLTCPAPCCDTKENI